MRNYWRKVYNRGGKVPKEYFGLAQTAKAFNNTILSKQFAHLIAKEKQLGDYIMPPSK